jgi:ribosomal protein L32
MNHRLSANETDNLAQARNAIMEGRNQVALQWIKKELASNPKNVSAILLAAQVNEDPRAKEQCYRYVLRIDPENLQAQIGLSNLKITQVENKQARPVPEMLEPEKALPETQPAGASKAVVETLPRVTRLEEPVISIKPAVRIPEEQVASPAPVIAVCPTCGSGREAGARFCAVCGTDFSAPELQNCPECGQERAGRNKYCSRCGYDFLKGAGKKEDPGGPAPVMPPVIHYPALPARFSVKRIITAVGMLLIIISGLLSWSSSRQWEGIFGGGYQNYTEIGLSQPAGQFSTGLAILGIILLFAVKHETSAHLLSTACALLAGLAAIGYITSQSWGYSGGLDNYDLLRDYASLGMGVYMVFVGAAIAVGCVFIPSKKSAPALAEVKTAAKPHQGLVIAGWALLAIGYAIGMMLGDYFESRFLIPALAVAILLIFLKRRRLHGIIIIAIWLVSQLLGFGFGFTNGFRF